MAEKLDVVHGRSSTARESELWTALATNAELLGMASDDRKPLLVERAGLWDQLAMISNAACGQAYRDAAAKCRAEAERLT